MTTLTENEKINWLAEILIREYSEDDFFYIAQGINSMTGEFEWAHIFTFKEFEEYGFNTEDVFMKTVYGNVINADYPVHINGYGNFESVTPEMMDEYQRIYAREVAEYIIDNIGYSCDVIDYLYQDEIDEIESWED